MQTVLGILNLIQPIHGLFRWVVAIAAILVIAKYAIGFLTSAKFGSTDHTLGAFYAGAITLQFLIGAVYLIAKLLAGQPFIPRLHGEHIVVGLVAVGLAHMMGSFRRRSDTAAFGGGLLMAVLSILAAIYNVIVVRGNWFYN
jgi:hypothetical protein